jgi:hypothetical protein
VSVLFFVLGWMAGGLVLFLILYRFVGFDGATRELGSITASGPGLVPGK